MRTGLTKYCTQQQKKFEHVRRAAGAQAATSRSLSGLAVPSRRPRRRCSSLNWVRAATTMACAGRPGRRARAHTLSARRRRCGAGAAAGLRCLWERSLVHRDIKPQNLLLSSEGPDAVLKIGVRRRAPPRGQRGDGADGTCCSGLWLCEAAGEGENGGDAVRVAALHGGVRR